MTDREREYSIISHMLTLLCSQKDERSSRRAKKHIELSEKDLVETDFAHGIKRFLDEIPGGFLIYQADGDERIVYANDALFKIFHCKNFAEFMEHTRSSFKGVVHPDDLDEVESSIEQQIAENSDGLDYVEYRIIRKDGIVRWVEDYGHRIRNDVTGDFYYVFISDATEKVTRRMAETADIINAGKAKEQHLRDLIEEYDRERKLIRQEHLQRLEVIEGLSVNYDSILYADLDANKVLPYRLSMRLERQFAKKLQVRELEWFLNDYVKVWVHPDDRTRVAEQTSTSYIRKKLRTDPTYYLNYRCIYNGEIQYIQLRIVNVGASDAVSQIVMGYRNVDEEIMQEMKQKQLLEVALNNAKLADVAKNAFLSNMSHDIRTPLNAVFGYAELAKKNLDDKAALKTALDKIEAASTQILDLVDKVLEISYLESQERCVTEEACNLLEILREVYDSASPLAKRKQIALTLNTVKLENSDVYADRHKLRQVISQIATNAVQYTPNGGSVDITAAECAREGSDFITYTFTVKDTGIGIAEDELGKIFEPFERVRNSTAANVFGSGLGLTISKHFIEMMDGSISVESAEGKGSVFTVTVSLRKQKPSASRRDKTDVVDFTGKKILIVEDNEINLEIETEILQDFGFITDTAENGKIAVEKIKASAPGEYSLILMDIQMPVMDGRCAAESIRRLDNPALASIPIIALSANAFDSDKRKSIEAGINAHLTKPIDVPLLIDTIKTNITD